MASPSIFLRPFASTPATDAFRIEARVERDLRGIRLVFRILAQGKGKLGGLGLAPAVGTGERRDGLWKTTCFECFFGISDSTAYFEFNGSPAGHWAWYRFTDYRAGMESPAIPLGDEPRIIRSLLEAHVYEAEWFIPLTAFANERLEKLNLTSVLDRDGTITYWATAHPGGAADFHARRCFTLLAP
jgi:hypothetical protein